MKVYNYDDTTGVYLGEIEADADPMAPLDENGEPTEWLLPAHSTTIAPPEPMPNAATVFENSAWKYVPNAVPEVTPEVTPVVEWVPPALPATEAPAQPAVAWVPPPTEQPVAVPVYNPHAGSQWIVVDNG